MCCADLNVQHRNAAVKLAIAEIARNLCYLERIRVKYVEFPGLCIPCGRRKPGALNGALLPLRKLPEGRINKTGQLVNRFARTSYIFITVIMLDGNNTTNLFVIVL